jgi:hypothetical protein
MAICRRGACWISKTIRAHAHTHTNAQQKYVIIVVFPVQLWARKRASVLRYTYIVCRVEL